MIRNMIIGCPVCGNRIENNDRNNKNAEVLEEFPDMYYIKAVCNKCKHLMLFTMNRDGKVIWNFDDTIENEIKINLKGE